MSLRTRKGAGIPYGAPPSVDLIPTGERERRERRALVRGWALGAAGALVVVGLAVVGTEVLARTAESQLQAERQRTTELAVELGEYAEVSRAVRLQATYEREIEQAMRTDVAWTPLLEELTGAMPPGVVMGPFDAYVLDAATGTTGTPVAPGGTATGEAPADAAASPSASASPAPPVTPTDPTDPEDPAAGTEPGTAVTLRLTFASARPLALTEMSRAFDGIEGVLDADALLLDRATSTDEGASGYTYAVTVDFDDTAYSLAFSGEER